MEGIHQERLVPTSRVSRGKTPNSSKLPRHQTTQLKLAKLQSITREKSQQEQQIVSLKLSIRVPPAQECSQFRTVSLKQDARNGQEQSHEVREILREGDPEVVFGQPASVKPHTELSEDDLIKTLTKEVP